ncbi:18168_t:CDS:2, partial [Gigaspora rosea]
SLVAMTNTDVKKQKSLSMRQTLKAYLKSLLKEVWLMNSDEEMCFNGRIRAAKTFLEKLLTTNNHLERMNDYLKNSQIKRFQRNIHTLKADILYVVLVYPSDCKILMQEFPQVAYLEPSKKRDESANIYTTCVYKKPTDICCQCLDFFQKGIVCKHLCTMSFYIDELHKQDEYTNLPEIIFATYKKAQKIRNDLDDNKLKKSKSAI